MTQSPPTQSVFVLVPSAVYDQGIAGVYGSREEAQAAANSLWQGSDGHHEFRVDEREIGVTYDVYQRVYLNRRRVDGTAPVAFVSESAAERWQP